MVMRKVLLFIVGVILLFIINLLSLSVYDEAVAVDEADHGTDGEAGECNVLGINLHGTLSTYIPVSSTEEYVGEEDVIASESIVASIDYADLDESIKAILVEVDSPGGNSVAAEEVANALKRAKKPTVAVIRNSGISAAYWAASGAETIFASRNSDVGSIGVTMSYNEEIEEGKTFVGLSAGKYKDAGNPNKPLSTEEKNLFLRDLKLLHENFIQDISINRKLSIEKVREIADGSSVLGVDPCKESPCWF